MKTHLPLSPPQSDQPQYPGRPWYDLLAGWSAKARQARIAESQATLKADPEPTGLDMVRPPAAIQTMWATKHYKYNYGRLVRDWHAPSQPHAKMAHPIMPQPMDRIAFASKGDQVRELKFRVTPAQFDWLDLFFIAATPRNECAVLEVNQHSSVAYLHGYYLWTDKIGIKGKRTTVQAVFICGGDALQATCLAYGDLR